jgi:tellurite resistance protein
MYSSQALPPCAIRVRKTSRVVEGDRLPTFTVEMKGQLPGPGYGSALVELFFHLFDMEKYEGGEPPVLSSFDVFQEESQSTTAFQCRKGPLEMSGERYYPEWTELFDFPLSCLGFPRKGDRKLKLRMVSVLADGTVEPTMFKYGYPVRGGTTVYGSAETIFSHSVTEPGWLDANRYSPKVWALTVELAMHISASDGNMNKAEAGIIKGWAKNVLSLVRKDKEERKQELNAAMARSFKDASGGRTALHPICDSLALIATDHQKYDALKLCVEVMSADGKADNTELKELDRIVALLGLDPNQYRLMLDLHLATVKIDTSGSKPVNPKTLFGIEDGMSQAEIRRKLTEATRKWNSRVTSSDSETMKRAQEMLKLIAELREDLLG